MDAPLDAAVGIGPGRPARVIRFRPATWLVVLAIGAVAIVAYATMSAIDLRWLFPTFGIAGSIAVFLGVYAHRPKNARRWIEVGCGVAMLALGDLTYTALQGPDGSAPFPSVADAIYLVGYGVLAYGFAGLIGHRGGGRDVPGILDALIVATSVGVIAWVTFLSSTIVDGSLTTGDLVAIAYPFMDLVLLALAVRIALGPSTMGIGRYLLVGGVVTYLVSDFIYTFESTAGTYAVGQLVDIGWMAAYTMWAAAALHPRMIQAGLRPTGPVEPRRTSLRIAGLGAATLVPALLLFAPAMATSPERFLGIAVSAIVLTVLVMCRVGTLFGEVNASNVLRRRLEGQLRHAADHDPLVGLWNRRVFHDRLTEILARDGQSATALFIDVDDFKAINDSFGHAAGDVVLSELASRIQSVLRPGDVAARLGGDEFGVIVEGPAAVDLSPTIAARLLEVTQRPIATEQREITISVSIGVAHSDGALDAQTLMRNADIAMYLAKERGKNRIAMYEEGAHARVLRHLELRADLEQALDAGQFALDYQPIVDLASGSILGVEALLRWDHPVRGRLPPSDFLTTLEELRLIVAVGRWVMFEACRQLGEWKRAGARDLYMSINLSPLQFRDPAIADDILAAAVDAGISPSDVVIEITESVVLDVDRSRPILERLRRHGVRIAIDDFGTGYSTIANLLAIPLDIMKVDQSFIAPLASGGRATAIVQDLLHIAQSMGVQAIAEGIEGESQRDALVAFGCSVGQGFLMGYPMDAGSVSDLLTAARSTAAVAAREARPRPDARSSRRIART